MKCYLKHNELETFGAYLPDHPSVKPIHKVLGFTASVTMALLTVPAFLLGLLFFWTFGVPITIVAILGFLWKMIRG